jgi:signal transduction histidine kinase
MVQSAEVTRQLLGEGQRLVLRDLVYRGTPYTVAYRPLGSPADTIVAFVVPTLDIAATTRAVTRSIAVVALGTTLLIAGLGYLIARSITAPIEQLVVFARKLGTGDRSSRVDVKSRDEIGILARAFNDMADELQTSEEKVLRSERLATAGQLAAAVAHDIRNPLSSIRMQAQLLRTKLQPGEVNQQVLASILREIDRVERVVRGLLDLVKPVELDLKPVQVDELVEQALAIVEAQLAHRKIAVERRLDATLPSPLLDGDRIVQALLNVIENAADAMPTGGTLGIATSASADRSAIRIEVSDDGEGIRPDVRDKLFAPFFTTKREGIGLGLVNTRGIVERHGGSIELLAGRPRGTRAVITLPVAPPRAGGPWPTS